MKNHFKNYDEYNSAWYYWIQLKRTAGVEFTKDEWIEWWKNTGKWDQRGKYREDYCMARIDYSLPYRADNVRCCKQKDVGKKGKK